MCGNPITTTEIQDFSEFMEHNDIDELPRQGEFYTWSNRQGIDRVMSRIDRVFGNYEWMLHWGYVTTNYGLPFISGHAPITLQIQPPQRVRRVSFKFFNR